MTRITKYFALALLAGAAGTASAETHAYCSKIWAQQSGGSYANGIYGLCWGLYDVDSACACAEQEAQEYIYEHGFQGMSEIGTGGYKGTYDSDAQLKVTVNCGAAFGGTSYHDIVTGIGDDAFRQAVDRQGQVPNACYFIALN